jgi:hypothetical protein
MAPKPAKIAKNFFRIWHLLPSQLKLVLVFTFLAGLVNLSIYSLAIQGSVKKLLSQQSQEISRLDQVKKELQEELRFYKEMRITNEAKLLQQLASLREELVKYKEDQEQKKVLGEETVNIAAIDQTLDTLEKYLAESKPSLPSSSQIFQGIVRIKDQKWEKVEVYEESKASSKIIGYAEYGTLYFLSQKEDNWCQIELEEGQLGWIQAQFISELP